MLKKQYRLKKKSAFSATYHIKHTLSKNGVTLFVGIKKKQSELPTKVGFVVSKKTHKRAVKRNRLRRLMRESYRLLQKNNTLGNSQNHLSLIFVAGVKALSLDFDTMHSSIKMLLEEL